MKHCPKCNAVKDEEAFYTRPRGDLQSWCIECMKALRRQRNPQIAVYQSRRRAARTFEEKQMGKDYQLRYHFGITLDDYEKLLKKQGYRCAVCSRLNGGDAHKRGVRGKQLSVDHDHSTGAVRGLLCNSCNRALGQLGDNIDRVRALLTYLEQFNRLLQEVIEARVQTKL